MSKYALGSDARAGIRVLFYGMLILFWQCLLEPILRRLFWPIALHSEASMDSGNLPCMWIAVGEAWFKNGVWGCPPPIPNNRQRKKLRQLLAVGRLVLIAIAVAIYNSQWLIALALTVLYGWLYHRAYRVGGFYVVYYDYQD